MLGLLFVGIDQITSFQHRFGSHRNGYTTKYKLVVLMKRISTTLLLIMIKIIQHLKTPLHQMQVSNMLFRLGHLQKLERTVSLVFSRSTRVAAVVL